MAFTIAQISDTHLSRARPFFTANFQCIAAHLASAPPDLIINTGDLSLDGLERPDDLIEARRLHESLPGEVLFIPGNHDVGDCQDVPKPHGSAITSDLRRRYLGLFGPDFWLRDVPGWRLIGIDAQLLGSNLPEASDQLRFIADAAAGADGRHIALFVHKPLFHLSADEREVQARFINPEPRRELMAAFGEHMPALVASGHVHQFWSRAIDWTCHVWAPSTGFFLPDSKQPVYGHKEVGYVEHRLEPDGSHTSQFVSVAGLQNRDITAYPGAYPGH